MLRVLRLLPLPVVAALALSVSACSGDSDDQESAPPDPPTSSRPDGSVDTSAPPTLAADLAALYAGDNPKPADRRDGRCFAAALLERVGPEDLRAAGILVGTEVVADASAMPISLAESWVDAQFACVDFVEESTRALVAQSKGKLDPTVYQRCMMRALTDEEIRAAVVQTLIGEFGGEAVQQLTVRQSDCARRSLPDE